MAETYGLGYVVREAPGRERGLRDHGLRGRGGRQVTGSPAVEADGLLLGLGAA